MMENRETQETETEYTEKMRGEGWEYNLINLLIIFGVTVSGSNVVNLCNSAWHQCRKKT